MTDFNGNYFMNVGPVPATGAGIFRLVAEMNGEKIIRIDPHIGFSHRGIEKLMEQQNCFQGLFFCDRLFRDIPFVSEYSYVLAAERLLGITPPERGMHIRVLLAELSRIISHLKSISNLAEDTGTEIVHPIAFSAAKDIYGFFQQITGVALPSAFFRVGGVQSDIPAALPEAILSWIDREFQPVLYEIEGLLTENRIFKSRTVGIGVFDDKEALAAGFSGINLRASGVDWDLRRQESYDVYGKYKFEVPIGKNGDSYTRYLLKVHEIYQSISLIRQILSSLPEGAVLAPELMTEIKEKDHSVEATIHRFELFSKGLKLPEGEVYAATESPLGEFGVYLLSHGEEKPYRCHFRSAGFPHLQALGRLVKGLSLSDVRPILSSLNIVMTEVDR